MPYSPLIEVFCLSLLPITLLEFRLVPKRLRLKMLGAVFFLALAILLLQKVPFDQLGFRIDNLGECLVPYIVTTLIGLIGLFIISRIRKSRVPSNLFKDPNFLLYFIPISFAQQFVFQGFITFELQSAFSLAVSAIVTALIFGYMHSIYPKPLFSFILGTLGGLLFAMVFSLFPNIYLATIMHSILNFTAVYLGFFSFKKADGTAQKTQLV